MTVSATSGAARLWEGDDEMDMARVGVVIDEIVAERRQKFGLNVFSLYLKEIFAHIGAPVVFFKSVDEALSYSPDVLLVGLTDENQQVAADIWRYAEQGGTVITFAGLNCLAAKLGCQISCLSGPGYAESLPYLELGPPLRFFGATPWERVKECEIPYLKLGKIKQANPNGPELGAALQSFEVGRGVIERWAVDIPATIVQLQQGLRPIFEDGPPAPDGSAMINDQVLKADDGFAMDWEWDRKQLSSGDSYFAHPYADFWREILFCHVLDKVLSKGLVLPFLDFWPDGISHVAFVSLDSDYNRDFEAETALQVLKECDIQTTWSMIEPGYGKYIYDLASSDGHELAFHYNAVEVDGGKWSEAEFERQIAWVKNALGTQVITSQKNHLTRWEGWGELFAWCETYGIASDQTRGGSKKGNQGFLFGTCQPYFPIAWSHEKNRFYDVLEIGFIDADFTFVDSAVIGPLLESVSRVRGVAHVVFHQTHLHTKPHVRSLLQQLVREARDRGYVFWTGKQINDWVRARRELRITGMDAVGKVTLANRVVPDGAVVCIPVLDEAVTEGDCLQPRFGVQCKIVRLDSSSDC